MTNCKICGGDAEIIEVGTKYKPRCTLCGLITEAEYDSKVAAYKAWSELMKTGEAE